MLIGGMSDSDSNQPSELYEVETYQIGQFLGKIGGFEIYHLKSNQFFQKWGRIAIRHIDTNTVSTVFVFEDGVSGRRDADLVALGIYKALEATEKQSSAPRTEDEKPQSGKQKPRRLRSAGPASNVARGCQNPD